MVRGRPLLFFCLFWAHLYSLKLENYEIPFFCDIISFNVIVGGRSVHKKIYGLALALIMVCSLFVLAGCEKDQEEKIVGEVNGDAITQKQFDQHYRLVLNYYEQNYGEIDEKKDKELVENLKDSTFEDLVIQKLIWQEAERRGMKVDEEQVEQDLAYIREQRNQQEENGYEKFLKENGFDEEFLKQEWKTQNMYLQLGEEVTKDVTVTEEECREYYEQNKEAFSHPGGKQIYHILVETKQEAEEVLAKLNQGESFNDLAAQYSIDPGSNTRGGDVGVVNQDTNFVEPFKEAALELQPGELLTTPVETEYGYHIIKAGQQVEEGIWPFEKVQESIEAYLLQDKKNQVFSEFLENLRANADIKDYRKS